MKLLASAIIGATLLSTCFASNLLEFRTPTVYASDECVVNVTTLMPCEKEEQPVPLKTVKELIVEETDLLETAAIIEAVPESVYTTITEEEREMLAKLVYLEAGICSQECQRAIASVIFNRLDAGCWKKDMNYDGKITLYDIVYYPAAFSPAYLIYKTDATQECYDAVDYVVKYGPTIPTYVRYFRINYDFKWTDYANYTTIDNVYFGYFTTWEQGAW